METGESSDLYLSDQRCLPKWMGPSGHLFSSTATGILLKPVGEKDINRCYKLEQKTTGCLVTDKPHSPKEQRGSLFIKMIRLLQQILIGHSLSGSQKSHWQGLLKSACVKSKTLNHLGWPSHNFGWWPSGKKEPLSQRQRDSLKIVTLSAVAFHGVNFSALTCSGQDFSH